MNMTIKATRCENFILTRNNFCSRPNHDCDAALDIGIACFANRSNAAIFEADIGFHNAPMIHNQRIGNHSIHGTCRICNLRLTHAITDDFAAAKFHFLAIKGEVFLHFNQQGCISEAHTIARCGTIHGNIGGTGKTI